MQAKAMVEAMVRSVVACENSHAYKGTGVVRCYTAVAVEVGMKS